MSTSSSSRIKQAVQLFKRATLNPAHSAKAVSLSSLKQVNSRTVSGLAWSGPMPKERFEVWLVLLGLMEPGQKRSDLRARFSIPGIAELDKQLVRLIALDTDRTSPDVPLSRGSNVQRILVAVLSRFSSEKEGVYLQGLNQICFFLLVVRLQEYFGELDFITDEGLLDGWDETELQLVEQQTFLLFRAVAKLLESNFQYTKLENSVHVFAGMETKLARLDERAALALRRIGLELIHFAFKWLYLMFVTVLPLDQTARLWDYALCCEDARGFIQAVGLCLILRKSELLEGSSFAEAYQLMQGTELTAGGVEHLSQTAYLFSELLRSH